MGESLGNSFTDAKTKFGGGTSYQASVGESTKVDFPFNRNWLLNLKPKELLIKVLLKWNIFSSLNVRNTKQFSGTIKV